MSKNEMGCVIGLFEAVNATCVTFVGETPIQLDTYNKDFHMKTDDVELHYEIFNDGVQLQLDVSVESAKFMEITQAYITIAQWASTFPKHSLKELQG
jgi:hypothetical protein